MLPHPAIHCNGAKLTHEDSVENSEQGAFGEEGGGTRGPCSGEGRGIENRGAGPLSSEIVMELTLLWSS